MKLLQWNIQWCRGMDGRVDPERIARAAKSFGNPDVCCFQEVAINYPDLDAAGDQPALLGRHLPGYSVHFAPVVDTPDDSGTTAGGRKQFGNLILSRLPVRQVFRHALPWPPQAGVPNMPRVAVEAVVEASWGIVSVFTTHLEFYSSAQRTAQVGRLCELKAEALAHSATPSVGKPKDSGPFTPFARPAGSILTGDFNMRAGDPLMATLLGHWRDAWPLANPGRAQPPTFGVFDNEFASEPYACDFVLVSEDLAPRVSAARVDFGAKESDHQPVIVEFRP
jgi:endonuclease/exonuclease/phosphatase family metal-dependent hydrolase